MRPVFQRFPRKRRYVLFGIGLLAVLLLWAPWSARDGAAPRYDYFPVTRTSIEETVTAQGKLEPKEFVDVGAQVSGQLKKLHVEIGDTVKKGELIAEIDPQIYNARVEADEARLKTLRAQLAEQQANVEFAQSVYNRNSKLVKADAVSKEVLQDSLRELKAAQARTNSFKAQIEEAESTLRGDRANLGFTKIYAPIDGTVVSQTSKEGQTLNANQLAPVIVQVADLDTMTVRAQVAEADVPRLKEGMPVYFTILGSERRWESTLRQLLPSPDATVLDVVLYNALVDVENADNALMTGMSTQMFFQLGSAQDALSIPTRALGKKLPAEEGQGETYEVLVKQGDKVVPKPVRIGLMSRTVAQVLDGLSEKDTVAVMAAEAPTSAGAAARRGPRIYTGLLALDARVAVAQKNLSYAQDVLRITELRYKEGAISGLERAQQRTNVANTEAAIAALQNQRALFFNQLALVCGVAPSALTLSDSEMLADLQVPAVQVVEPWQLLARRPDIAAAEARLRAANINIGVARANALPSLSLGLNAGVVSNPSGTLVGLAASFFAPIFQGGALQAEIDRSAAARNEQIAIYESVLLTAFREVEDALNNFDAATTRRDALGRAADEARNAQTIARARFDAGSIDYTTLIQTQNVLLQAEDSYFAAIQAQLAAHIDLVRALGGTTDA